MNISTLSRNALISCTAATVLAGCDGAQSQIPAFTLPTSSVQMRSAAPQPHDPLSSASSTLRIEPAGPVKGHLYVAGSSASSGTVERFRIIDGVPESRPDRTYSGVGAPIAIDSHGYLYATIEDAAEPCGGIGNAEVVVYAPHSNSPVRTLELTPSFNQYLGISSLFVDREGHVYVGISVTVLGAVGGGWAVNVYSPGAGVGSGCVEPARTFDSGFSQNLGGVYTLAGLTTDAQGNLHASNNSYDSKTVLSFASPITDPKQIAALTGSGIVSPSGLAVDASDELYVDNAGQGMSSFVAAYPATANGNPKPDRKISVSGAQSFGNGIAVAAGRLIIPDNIANAVYEVRTTRRGTQTPIWTLALSPGFSPQDVKLGP